MGKIFIILLTISIIAVFSTATFAAQKSPVETKIERGVKNVALGWTEIPKSIKNTSNKSNIIVGLTAGTIKGVFQAVARTISGAVDVVTFPVGTYNKPAIKPSMIPETMK